MARGSKESYSNKQKRMAHHIEDAYTKDGSSQERAERIAWATVNKESGGAAHSKKSGSKRSHRSTK